MQQADQQHLRWVVKPAACRLQPEEPDSLVQSAKTKQLTKHDVQAVHESLSHSRFRMGAQVGFGSS